VPPLAGGLQSTNLLTLNNMDKLISGLLACAMVVKMIGVPLLLIIILLIIALLFLKAAGKK
jgi:energy-coupling factor transporter transmembrane protein EcfT